MHKVFSYGTLVDKFSDKIFDYGTLTANLKMDNFSMFNALVIDKDCHTVYGTILELSDNELAEADKWEGHPDLYKRVYQYVDTREHGLIKTWVYILNIK